MQVTDFDEFFEQLYGYVPFPWQSLLLREVVEQGSWPAVLDLPTSAGKTAAIDIAVFHLAMQAPNGNGVPFHDRTAPLRVFFVVDRRVVVDEAFDRATALARKLQDAVGRSDGVLSQVAKRLLRFGGHEEEPLHVAIMRGGTYRDDGWARSPIQPTVCVSTVDQVGSRLLFRGYGISEFSRPIHAGLIGCDSLILVDEAHLSEPFLQTLDAVKSYSADQWASERVARPLSVVRMSATTQSGEEPFRIGDADRKHPVLQQRLEASKVAQLRVVETEKDAEDTNQRRLVGALAGTALELAGLVEPKPAGQRGARRRIPRASDETAVTPRVVAIVSNRVNTAREVFEQLERWQQEERCYAILLTGRMRPFDRDELLYRDPVNGQRGWFAFCKANRTATLDRPLFVVATQTIEVGANLDFDSLVTEAAALDALRQRFGRLDRLGERKTSSAAIVVRNDAVGRSASDPIYGDALAKTWKWLLRKGGRQKQVDVGLTSMESLLASLSSDALDSMCTPRADAPVLMPAYIDRWCQTSPAPAHEPDVSLFLHGRDGGPADVQVVWRSDVLSADEREFSQSRHSVQRYRETLALSPPSSAECLSIPIYVLQRWLREETVPVADVEGAALENNQDRSRRGRQTSERPVLRWQGEKSDVIFAQAIRPGDTVVLPIAYGGLDRFGWNPDSKAPVSDIADGAALLVRWRPQLRLHPSVVRSWSHLDNEALENLASRVSRFVNESSDESVEPDFDGILQEIEHCSAVPGWVRRISHTLRQRSFRSYRYADDSGWLLRTKNRVSRSDVENILGGLSATAPDDDISLDDESPLLVGESASVGLEEHCRAVRDNWVAKFADKLGLPHRRELLAAALFHDTGKADYRFQVMLHGGDEIAALTDGLLAKSGMDPNNRNAFRQAYDRSQLPRGFRHEMLSVHLFDAMTVLGSEELDRAIIRYLIGTHHGRGRPWMPVVSGYLDGNIESLSLDGHQLSRPDDVEWQPLYELASGWTDLFWQMVRRFGYWGIAYLEAILRLADWEQSDKERACVTTEESAHV